MDTILIKGLRLMACHGVLPQEKQTPQPFVLDIILGLDLRRAGNSDALEDTVNYAEAVELVTRVVCDEQYELIERLASRVAAVLLERYPIEQVTVRLHKPEAPIEADFADVAVEITRTKEEYR